MNKVKVILTVCIGMLLTLGMANFYWVHFANRFEVVSEGKSL